MQRNLFLRAATLACATAMLTLVGCSAKTQEAMWGKPDKAEAKTSSRAGDGMVHSSAAFPTGNKSSSALLIEQVAPRSVQLNSPFQYEITATNLTDGPLHEVVVTERIPEDLKVTGSSPRATKSGQKLSWKLGKMEAGATETITLEAEATGLADLTYCAAGSYSLLACATTSVTQPDLALSKTVNAERSLICDPILYTFTVRNDGSGPASNVVVRDPLPAGLTTTDGRDEVVYNVGTLAAGGSRTFSAEVKASEPGEYSNTAVATADGDLRSEAETEVTVVQPVLDLDKSGPENAFITKNVTYTITVTNTGDGVARNTVVRDTLPAEATFVSATGNGTAADRTVTWNVGNLAPEASREFEVTIRPTAQGRINNAAVASAHCAQTVEDSVETNITGIAAILLEVVDQNDPVQVGQNEIYTITVTNQGSAADGNIQLVATMEDEMSYVSLDGPTGAEVDGRTITFEPLERLAAGATATWRLTIKADRAGDQRVQLKVEMSSEEMPRSVMETEATNFYE